MGSPTVIIENGIVKIISPHRYETEEGECIEKESNTYYKRVLNKVISNQVAIMVFTTSAILQHGMLDTDSVHHNMVNNNSQESPISYKEERIPIKNIQQNSKLIAYNFGTPYSESHNIVNEQFSSDILAKIAVNRLTDSVLSPQITDIIDTSHIEEKEGVLSMVNTLDEIDKKIRKTYNYSALLLSGLAATSFISVIGLNFLPSPIDSTLLVASTAGALGLFIDKIKRVKVT
ncbi:hypothetical protein K7887_18535 [Sutcliffiella horikoshii]|uniref:hypothetical protein n=1 Tax=Sutcliffiella horikoshii TaxID=79883 RepID=UPI001CC13AE6|nr:hypothetical protein [Sutcliffiella horikoshii]UAL46839.1 hypothetical protein K7887_18535 [Sutcliffiella horikoshii]